MLRSPIRVWAACCFLFLFAVPGVYARMLPIQVDSACTGSSASFGQCGGITCSDGSGSHCSDSAYSCCPSGNSCQRQNEWYWQCLPGTSATTPMTTSAPAPEAEKASPASPSTESSPDTAQVPPRAFESHVVTQPARICMVAGNNADYPNGLQCQGYLSFPACCQNSDCHTYKYWDASETNTAYLTSSPEVGLASSSGACYQNFTLGCCPAVPPGQ